MDFEWNFGTRMTELFIPELRLQLELIEWRTDKQYRTYMIFQLRGIVFPLQMKTLLNNKKKN